MTPRYAVLVGQLQQFLAELQQVVDRSQQLLQKYRTTQDNDYIGTLALNLHSFYTGVERCLEEIAHQLDDAIPSGTDWHRRLLQQMSAELPDLRPPVIRATTRQKIDEYRAFRHVVRNVYTFDLQPERVVTLTEKLGGSYTEFRSDVEAFCHFLRDASKDLEK
ncbi:MAG: hypothetical protein K6T90_22155 [Leptolyngbyaceae cyanobacterium HOT.MB2.61]|jgi:hypothetical protein|nr:hypothetical protein [Leptolyngbyaceae cyanobacterium HOT.MB2.61]